MTSHEISFLYRASGQTEYAQAQVHNLGPGGLSATLSTDMSTGDTIEFELTIGTGKVIRGTGTVSWSSGKSQPNGMSFIDLDEHAREILLLWLASQR